MLINKFKNDIFIFIILYLFLTALVFFQLSNLDDKKKFFKQFEIQLNIDKTMSLINQNTIYNFDYIDNNLIYLLNEEFNNLLIDTADHVYEIDDHSYIISFFDNDINNLNNRITNFRKIINDFENNSSNFASLNSDYISYFKKFTLNYLLKNPIELTKFKSIQKNTIESKEDHDPIEKNENKYLNEAINQKTLDHAKVLVIKFLDYININEMIIDSKNNSLVSISEKEVKSDYLYENLSSNFLYRYMIFTFLYTITIFLFYKLLIKKNQN